MSAPKTAVVHGLLVDVEGTYGSMATLSAANHSVQLAELPDIGDDYAWDGSRPSPPGTAATQRRVAPQGRIIKPLQFKVEDKGGGAAYSGSVKPKDTSALLRIAGWSEVLDATGGLEKYTNSPTPATSAPSSGSLEAYCRSNLTGNVEKWAVNGAYADWTYEVENGQPGMWTFDVQGRLNGAPSEVAWPSWAYAHTVVPPVAAPLQLSLNGVTSLVCRKITVKGNRGIQARYADQNVAAAHAGFHPGRRAVKLIALIEKPLFATTNFHALRDAATVLASSFQVGSVQYNRSLWSFPQGQVESAVDQNDDTIPLIEVTIACHASTPIANDDVSLVRS